MTGKWDWTALASQPATAATSTTDVKTTAANASERPLNPTPAVTKAPITTTNEKKSEETESFSKLRILDRTISSVDLEREMKGRQFIALRAMDSTENRKLVASESIDWVTIGVIVRKTISKAASNGASFMVWGLSDLENAEIGLFLYNEAYASHWREMEGSLVAVLNATVVPATDKTHFALKATQPDQVVRLGRAKDFGICKGTTSAEARCKLAVNTAKSQYCLHHMTSNFIKAGRGRQQLNNSLGNMRKTLFTNGSTYKTISAGVYTSAKPSTDGWNPTLTKKRKRLEPGTMGVPTRQPVASSGALMLSASGAVLQATQRSVQALNARPQDLKNLVLPSSSGPPKRASRGEKIISSFLSKTTTKKKKVDMMQFMTKGNVN